MPPSSFSRGYTLIAVGPPFPGILGGDYDRLPPPPFMGNPYAPSAGMGDRIPGLVRMYICDLNILLAHFYIGFHNTRFSSLLGGYETWSVC